MNKVIVIMGSDSDLPIMKGAAEVLESFGVEFEMRIISAHRTPAEAFEVAAGAAQNGAGVIIAAAGGAAHLAGVIAAHTILPVIGVPILGPSAAGLDSLLSMVQMPSGIPVATVAVNGAKNAGILAVQILAVSDENLKKRLAEYKAKMAEEVKAKDSRLQSVGYKAY